MIPIFNTYIDSEAFNIVKETLTSTFISEGKLVKNFEEELTSKLGIKNPVALNSGTSALHLALVLAGIKEGDEVICPAQTFVATAIVIIQQGAIPVFADIQYATGNIDIVSVKNKITPRTKAILAVHWGGYPCDMNEINNLAKEYGLIVIEDAAHAIGATYHEQPIGTLSDYTCFSFQAIKHITTGDGGALSCLEATKYKEAMTRRWFGINRSETIVGELGERIYNIEKLGFKYHLNDYAAALGLANLEHFSQRLELRRKWAAKYRHAFAQVAGIELFEEKSDRKSAYWLFGMHVEKRVDFINQLKDKGIAASVIHQRIDRNKLFGGLKEDLIHQKKFDETQIHIPMHDALDDEKIEYIINIIKTGW